jgi:hypothetical protein
MELVEEKYTLTDIINAAQLILDQAIIQKKGVGIFEYLGFGYSAGSRMYVTDDRLLLIIVVHRLDRAGRTYFLGSVKTGTP